MCRCQETKAQRQHELKNTVASPKSGTARWQGMGVPSLRRCAGSSWRASAAVATSAHSPTPSSSSERSRTSAAVPKQLRGPGVQEGLSPISVALGMKLCWDFASNGTCKYGALGFRAKARRKRSFRDSSHRSCELLLRRSVHARPWPPRAPGARPRASGAVAQSQSLPPTFAHSKGSDLRVRVLQGLLQ